jgi:hypothetical protein
MYEVDEVGGGSGGSGGCPYESPMYESPIHKRTPRAGSIAVGSCWWWKNWKPVEALFGI